MNPADGRCYRGALPDEVVYHQRRNAFRAALKLAQLVSVELGGDKLKSPVDGKLLDISATGCKLRFDGDITERLQLGQVYERFIAALPFGNMTAPVELRYLHFEEKDQYHVRRRTLPQHQWPGATAGRAVRLPAPTRSPALR